MGGAFAKRVITLAYECIACYYGRSPINKHLHVEVSYNDGGSWDELPVSGSGSAWKAVLEHPEQSGYVSLRGEIRGANGTSSKVTLIRAYRLE